MIFFAGSLAQEICTLAGSMDDETCENCGAYEDFSLNGHVEMELPSLGAYAGIVCNRCGQVKYVGDGDFFHHYVMTEDGIISKGDLDLE